jgi:hypothetical protein
VVEFLFCKCEALSSNPSPTKNPPNKQYQKKKKKKVMLPEFVRFLLFASKGKCKIKTGKIAGRQWLMLVILATEEAEIRRITVRSQPGQIVHEPLSRKNHH